MPKRTPYLEICLTVAVLAFVAMVIAGGFNQRGDDAGRVSMRPEFQD
jgi:hypothetical protein